VPDHDCFAGLYGQGVFSTFSPPILRNLTLFLPLQIWDISTSPPLLLSTFSFPTPVSHIAWDSLERFFFAAGPSPNSSSFAAAANGAPAPPTTGSRVVRVNLYKKKKDEFGMEAVEQVAGLGRGEVERVGQSLGEGEVYEIPFVLFLLSYLSCMTTSDRSSPFLVLAAKPSPA
jgi:hypothetical protein